MEDAPMRNDSIADLEKSNVANLNDSIVDLENSNTCPDWKNVQSPQGLYQAKHNFIGFTFNIAIIGSKKLILRCLLE